MTPGLLVAFCVGHSVSAAAQTAHFSWAQTTVASVASPTGVAVDGRGNLYIVDTSDSTVLKLTPSDLGYTQSTVANAATNGLISPFGVAVDDSGNLYIADAGNSRIPGSGSILKETLSGGLYSQSVVARGLNQPMGVAVQGAAVYVAATGDNEILKETLSGGAYVQSTIADAASNGLRSPYGVAVDPIGNVYIADSGNNRVLSESPSGSFYVQSVVDSGLYRPESVTFDGSGNLYVADTRDNRVWKETWSGGVYTESPVGTGLSEPAGVSMDGNGNLYIADTLNSRVLKLQTSGVDFKVADVGGSSSAISLVFTFDTGGYLPAFPAVLTQGASGKDFVDAGTGSCTTYGLFHAYGSGSTCTVDVVFKPQSPGMLHGAVVMSDGSGDAIATGYIYGVGTGPQVSFQPATKTTVVSTGFSSLGQVAVDGAGNLYASDTSHGQVFKETLSSGGHTQSLVVGGLSSPDQIAIDGAGNVYIADSGNQRVLKETPTGSRYTQTTVAAGLNAPGGVAVDGSGNLYVADTGNNSVLKETLSGMGYVRSTVAAAASPFGVVVDGGGSVYIAEKTSGQVVKETLSGGSYTESIVGSGLQLPVAVATDGSGNIYIADAGNGHVLQETLSNGVYTQSLAGGGLDSISGVALDSSNNIYITDSANLRILKIAAADAPSLSFTTSENATSSSQSVTVFNIGNTDLTIPLLSSGSNPSVASGFNIDNSSNCPQLTASSTSSGTLAPGASCTLLLSFSPTTLSTYAGSLVLTDDTLNANPSTTQTIALTGVTTPPREVAPAVTWAAPAAISYGTALSGTQLDASSTVAGTFTYTPAAGAVLKAGNQALTVIFTPTDAADYATQTATTTITVNKATPAVTWAAPAAISYGTALSGTQLDASSTVAGTFTYTPAAGGVLGAGANQPLSVIFTPTDATDYTTQTAATTITVAQATQTINFSALPAQVAYGAAPVGLVTTSTSGLPVSYSITGPASVSGSSLTFTGAGTVVVMALQRGNANYTAAAPVSRTIQVLQAQPTLSFAPVVQSLPYGVALGAAVLDAAVNNSIAGSVVYTAALSGGVTTPVNGASVLPAGAYLLTATFTPRDTADYSIAKKIIPLTITQRALTVTVDSATKAYGAALPMLTGAVNGLLNGDAVGGDIAVAYSTAAVAASAVIPEGYAITASISGRAAANYSVTIVPGTLSITPDPLTATVTGVSFAYGQGVPAITGILTGVLPQDAGKVGVICSTPATSTSNVGSYPITVALTGGSARNYTVHLVASGSVAGAGVVTIMPAALRVAVGNATRGYGLPNPAFASTMTGLAGSDTLKVTYVTTATSASPAGTYPISATLAGASLGNYSPSIGPGVLTVTAGTLDLTANNATRVYGTQNQPFSGTIAGQQNGDVFTESFATPAVLLSNAGTYPIVPSASGPSLGDYQVKASNGILTVTQAAATIALAGNGATQMLSSPVTLTANATSATTGVPTGTASFFDGNSLLSAVALGASGEAVYSTSSLTVGTHVLKVVYSGDANFGGGASAVVSVDVIDFTVDSGSSGATQTVAPGGAATYDVALTPPNGVFPEAVTFAVTGLPPGATYTLSPAEIPAGAGATNVVFTIHTAKATAAIQTRRMSGISFAFLMLPLLGMGLARRRGSRYGSLLAMVLVCSAGVGMVGIAGCGEGGFFSQAPRTYVVQLTATSGALQHTTSFNVTVE